MLWFILSLSLSAVLYSLYKYSSKSSRKICTSTKRQKKTDPLIFFGMKKNIHAQKLLIFQFNTHNVIPLKCNRINTRWMRRRPIHFTLYSKIRCYAEIPHIKITSFSSTIYIKKQRGLNGESWIKKIESKVYRRYTCFVWIAAWIWHQHCANIFLRIIFHFFFFGKYFFSLALFTLNVANVLNFIFKYKKKKLSSKFSHFMPIRTSVTDCWILSIQIPKCTWFARAPACARVRSITWGLSMICVV